MAKTTWDDIPKILISICFAVKVSSEEQLFKKEDYAQPAPSPPAFFLLYDRSYFEFQFAMTTWTNFSDSPPFSQCFKIWI